MIYVSSYLFLFLILLALFTERKQMKQIIRHGWYYGASHGGSNGLCNYFVMVLTNSMNASLLFPLMTAGGVLLTSACSLLIFKERLTKIQCLGMTIGIMAVIFLNV